MFHFLILITVSAALLDSYILCWNTWGLLEVSCDFGNKFRSDIIAAIPEST